MLDGRGLLTGMALGAGETATLPLGHGAHAPMAYPGKRPLPQMTAYLGAAY